MKFLIMHDVSFVLVERFIQDPLETYFCKQHSPGGWKANLLFYDFDYTNTMWNQKVCKPIATGNVRGENIKFESDRTSSMSEKIKTRQYSLSWNVLRSHQIPSYPTNTTSKLNQYINKCKKVH